MDYNILLDLVEKLGYRLAISGAETFRIEESVNRIFAAYGIGVGVCDKENILVALGECCKILAGIFLYDHAVDGAKVSHTALTIGDSFKKFLDIHFYLH